MESEMDLIFQAVLVYSVQWWGWGVAFHGVLIPLPLRVQPWRSVQEESLPLDGEGNGVSARRVRCKDG